MGLRNLLFATIFSIWVILPVDPGAHGGIIGVDDRVPSSNPAVGRMPGAQSVNGTVWLTLNGALITANHVPLGTKIEFNVPRSNPDGSISRPLAKDIYDIDTTSIVGGQSGFGYDFKVFRSRPNAETNLLPLEAQKAFFRVYDGGYYPPGPNPPSAVQVTGYGKDYDCDQYGCVPNADNYSQQTAVGDFIALVDLRALNRGIMLYHRADTESGSSGGPIHMPGTALAIGIQAQGPDTCLGFPGENNCGPSFFLNERLINAINSFTPANTVYLDNGHPSTQENGSVFGPYHTLSGAVAGVNSGGTIGIVAGTYNETITIGKPVRLVAPVGTVTIGGQP
jgi:hypothetical protein